MQRFINNWTATLTAPAAASAPELSIEPVQAAKLVGLGTGDYYLLTLVKLVDEVEVAWEIVKVTAAASGVLTVERAQEGTAALEWLLGEPVSARFTAEGAEALRSAGGAAVGDATPQSLGPATPGTSPLASRQDHRHALPTPAAIGAATSAQGALAATAVQPAALASGLDGKVDKVAGKGLSEEDFTTPLRTKLIGLEPPNFRGTFTSFAAMVAGVAAPVAGNSADVDAGAGVPVVRYIWDATDEEWQTGTGGGGPASTDSLPEGATNLYFTVARVLASALTGLSVLAGGPVVSTDSVLAAFGKLQRQINDLTTALSGKQATLVSGTNIKSINGNSLLGSGDLTVSGGAGSDWGDIGGTLADQTDLQAALTARALVVGLPSRTITASGAVTPADAGKWLICTSATPITLTIGAEATAAWTTSGILPMFHVLQVGAGAVTITGDGFSVTLHASDTNVLAGAGAAATAVWRAANTWSLIGRLVAA